MDDVRRLEGRRRLRLPAIARAFYHATLKERPIGACHFRRQTNRQGRGPWRGYHDGTVESRDLVGDPVSYPGGLSAHRLKLHFKAIHSPFRHPHDRRRLPRARFRGLDLIIR